MLLKTNHDTKISTKNKAGPFVKFDDPHRLGKNQGLRICFSHLQSFSFLKKEATCDFGQGAVAMQVGVFSGCSIHSLCLTPAASSFSARFFSCVSPFTSNVTYLQKVLQIKTRNNATQVRDKYGMQGKNTEIRNVLLTHFVQGVSNMI